MHKDTQEDLNKALVVWEALEQAEKDRELLLHVSSINPANVFNNN